MPGTIDTRLAELGLTLPAAAAPAAKYVPTVITGNLLYVSGQISKAPGGEEVVGKLGAGLSIEDGQKAAQICALNILAHVKTALGDLDRVTRIVRLNGLVNSAPDFGDHPLVVNGASNLIGSIFGERGEHTRCAFGVAALPFGVAVEIDAIIEFA